MSTQHDNTPRLISTSDAARILGIAPITLQKARWLGPEQHPLAKIPTVRVGRSIRYRLTDITAFIEDNTQRS